MPNPPVPKNVPTSRIVGLSASGVGAGSCFGIGGGYSLCSVTLCAFYCQFARRATASVWTFELANANLISTYGRWPVILYLGVAYPTETPRMSTRPPWYSPGSWGAVLVFLKSRINW